MPRFLSRSPPLCNFRCACRSIGRIGRCLWVRGPSGVDRAGAAHHKAGRTGGLALRRQAPEWSQDRCLTMHTGHDRRARGSVPSGKGGGL